MFHNLKLFLFEATVAKFEKRPSEYCFIIYNGYEIS